MGGWGIIAADVIVMANLAQIAGSYGFLLFGAGRPGRRAPSGRRSPASLLDRRDDLHLLPRHRGLRAAAVRAAQHRGRRPGRRSPSRAGARSTPATRPTGRCTRRCRGSGPSGLELVGAHRARSCWRSSSTGAGTPRSRSTRRPTTRTGPRAAPRSSRPAAAGHLRRRLVATVAFAGVGDDRASAWATRTTPTTCSTRSGRPCSATASVGRIFQVAAAASRCSPRRRPPPRRRSCRPPATSLSMARLQGAPRRVRQDPPAVPHARRCRRSGWARSRSPSTSA